MRMRRRSFLFFAALLLIMTEAYDDSENEIPGPDTLMPYEINEEYIRHISSIINAYRSDITGDMVGGRLIIETNSQIDTKFKTWKRNADLINSLLALPKGMNDAGR